MVSKPYRVRGRYEADQSGGGMSKKFKPGDRVRSCGAPTMIGTVVEVVDGPNGIGIVLEWDPGQFDTGGEDEAWPEDLVLL